MLITVMACLTAAVANGSPSQLSGAAYMVCDGTSHTVTVSGMYFYGIPGEYTSIVLERQAVGICLPAELLVDYAQPFAPEPSQSYEADYTCTFVIPAPALQIVYRYVPYGVKADNSLQAIWTYCDNDWRGYAQVDCVDMPFLRGTVTLGSTWPEGMAFRIDACEEDCWSTDLYFEISSADLSQYAGEPALGLLGQVVDVFGARTYCGMIGDPTYHITKVERAALGSCGPVPVETANWGSVKALFR